MLYLLMREPFGRAAALAAGLLAAFSFGLDVLGSAATSEGLYLLLLFGILLAIRAPAGPPNGGRSTWIRAAAIGVGAGLLALTRAEGIVLGSALAALWILSPVEARRPADAPARRLGRLAITLALIAFAAAAITLAPWTIRNARSLHAWNETTGRSIGVRLPTFVPVTSYGPLNFALANNGLATGGFQRKALSEGSSAPVLDLAIPQHRHYFLHGTAEGLSWIARHPGDYAALALRKLGIATRALDLGWTPWNLPMGRSGTRPPVDLFRPDSSWLRWLQLLLAGAGIALALRARPRRTRAILSLLLPVASVLLATLLFFGYVRQGMLAAPFLFAFEGIAIASAASRLPTRVRSFFHRRTAQAALLVLCLALLTAAALQNRNYVATGETDRPGGMLLRDAPIHLAPAR